MDRDTENKNTLDALIVKEHTIPDKESSRIVAAALRNTVKVDGTIYATHHIIKLDTDRDDEFQKAVENILRKQAVPNAYNMLAYYDEVKGFFCAGGVGVPASSSQYVPKEVSDSQKAIAETIRRTEAFLHKCKNGSPMKSSWVDPAMESALKRLGISSVSVISLKDLSREMENHEVFKSMGETLKDVSPRTNNKTFDVKPKKSPKDFGRGR